MTQRLLARAVLLAALSAASPALGGARMEATNEKIHRNSVNTAGGRATATGLVLTHAVGETGVTAFSAAGFRLASGLMRNFAQPGSVASITALSKSTGTLELAWTAPGLDGNNGNVSGGSYRIDYSSDPLHPFSPDTYVTSFATTVAAGAAQSYRVTGLSPNTTYFARVYLADSEKVASESSAASAESTLANVPPSPVVTGAFSSSVTISWALPSGGAAGFRVDAASGAALGPSVTTTTVNGFAVSITVAGLVPNTTYYLKLGSLNWQKDVNFTTVLVAFTAAGGPVQIQSLATVREPLLRRVQLSWTNTPFINPAGVLVQVSTNPITSTPADGVAYAVGTKFPDGSVVKAGGLASSHLETSLELDTTAYFSLYSKDTSNAYSVAVSTFLVLDLPPRAVAGLTSARNPAGTQVTLTWNLPTSNSDSSPFKNPSAPIPWELQHFEVQVATGVIRPTWTTVSTLTATATTFTAVIPDPAKTYFYRVVSVDGYGPDIDTPMTSSTGGEVFVTSTDGFSTLRIPSTLVNVLQPSGNPTGKTLLARAKEVPGDLAGKVMKSVTFEFVDEQGKPVSVTLPDRSLEVSLRYETLGGKVVPSAMGAHGGPLLASAFGPEAGAADSLGVFWFNGREHIKLYGTVDTVNQTVSVRSSMPGNYQIRTLARDQGVSFDVSGMSNKVITPNGDGLNDTVVFTVDNPRQSSVSGKVYDIRGAAVADMAPGPVTGGVETLVWDGKAGGVTVSRGVYLYQIQGDGKSFTGTLLVIR